MTPEEKMWKHLSTNLTQDEINKIYFDYRATLDRSDRFFLDQDYEGKRKTIDTLIDLDLI